MKHAHMGMFHVYGWRGMVPNAMGGGEPPKDKEHTLIGVFFVFGRKGWGWGWDWGC